MLYRLRHIILIVVLMLTTHSMIAQDDSSNASATPDAFPLTYDLPEGFEAQPGDDDDTVLVLSDGETIIQLFPASVLEVNDSSDDTLPLEDTLLTFLTARIDDFEVPESLDFAEVDDDDINGLVYDIEGYGSFVIILTDDDSDSEIESLVIIEGDLDDEVLLPFLQSIENEELAQVACLISTDQERTVRLHVGPGTNRTSVAFLPVGETFEPAGEAEADDGSRWFKLDKSQAAPNSSALEIWVAAENVTQEGDCTTIGEASAPPIIPIIQQPQPSTSGSDDSGDDGADSDGTADDSTSTAPAAGALNVNDPGPAEITITLQEGVFTPTFNQFAYYVVRVTESQGLVETELCARSSVSEEIRCSVFEAYQLVGLNTFQSTSRSSIYMIFNSSTSYGLYSANRDGALLTLYIRSLDNLPDEIRPFSALENR